MPHAVGDRIQDRFEVRQILSGGMSEVYACIDFEREMLVVLKTFRHEFLNDIPILRRFEDEIASWIAIGSHENVVECLTVVVENSRPYLVLEAIRGTPETGHNVREWLRRRPPSPLNALDVAIDVCRGLLHVQSVHPGFVHCDIKPENILLEEGPNGLLTDFGLVHLVQLAATSAAAAAPASLMSGAGGAPGTPAYMSPEQWLGEPLDARTDIYAIGCVLFEMLSGRPIFGAQPIAKLREHHLAASPPQLKGIQEQLETVVRRCLEKSPNARFPSIATLLDELVACYRHIAHRDPEPLFVYPSGGARHYAARANALTIIGRHEEALALFDRAITLEPAEPGFRIDRGRLLLLMERHEDALRALDSALELDPRSPIGLGHKAQTLTQLNRLAEAVEMYGHAIAYAQGNIQLAAYHLGRSFVYAKLGDRNNEFTDLHKALEFDPKFAEPHYSLGLWHLQEGKATEALSWLDRAIELNPRHARALVAKGFIKEAIGEHRQARQTFEAAERIDPTVLPFRKVLTDRMQGPWRVRLGELHKVEEEAAPASLFIERGTLLGKAGRLNEALAIFNEGLERYPDDAGLWSSRGTAHSARGDTRAAIADFEHAIDLDPSDVVSWYNIGNLLLKSGRVREAIARYDEVIRLDPDGAQAHSNRGSCWQYLDDLVKAERDFRRAIELQPLLPQPHYGLGGIEVARGEFSAALAHFERAAKLGSLEAASAVRQLKTR